MKINKTALIALIAWIIYFEMLVMIISLFFHNINWVMANIAVICLSMFALAATMGSQTRDEK